MAEGLHSCSFWNKICGCAIWWGLIPFPASPKFSSSPHGSAGKTIRHNYNFQVAGIKLKNLEGKASRKKSPGWSQDLLKEEILTWEISRYLASGIIPLILFSFVIPPFCCSLRFDVNMISLDFIVVIGFSLICHRRARAKAAVVLLCTVWTPLCGMISLRCGFPVHICYFGGLCICFH